MKPKTNPKINFSDELKYLLRHAEELPLGNREEPPSLEELVSYERAAQLLRNVRLMAEFTYHFPQYPDVVAEPILRQFDDLAPTLPEFYKFVRFWKRELIGPLVRIDVTGCELIKAHEIRALEEGKIFYLH
jgi:uncharacterized protein Usg